MAMPHGSAADPRTSEWFMVGGLGPVAVLLASYLYFVLSLGPRLMQHRKPFKLEKLLIVYNAIQVVCSLHVVKEVSLDGCRSSHVSV